MADDENTIRDFHGEVLYSLDASRRVMLPSDWRPTDKKVVFRVILWPIGAGQHLLVLPPARWNVMLEKLRAKSLMDVRVAALERTIGATSAALVMDAQGRLCLPDKLAAAAGLEKEALFVGRLDKFEIWNPQRYQAAAPVDVELAAALAKEIDL